MMTKFEKNLLELLESDTGAIAEVVLTLTHKDGSKRKKTFTPKEAIKLLREKAYSDRMGSECKEGKIYRGRGKIQRSGKSQ